MEQFQQLLGRPGAPDPTDIENAYELLNDQGEWYLDRAADIVYYIPRPEDNMGQAVVVAGVIERLVAAEGTPASPIRNVQFNGITFGPRDVAETKHGLGFRGRAGELLPDRDRVMGRERVPGRQYSSQGGALGDI